jgi:hypothetical protein
MSGISGDKTEASQGNTDYWVVKLTNSGSIEWQNTIGGSNYDALYAVVQTTEGDYLLGGYSDSGVSGDKTKTCRGSHDYWVVKLTNSGSIEWQNTIGGNSSDYLYSVIQSGDGGYLIGGSSYSSISGDKTEANKGLYTADYWVVKLDISGNMQWQNTTGGDDNDYLYSIIQTSDGGYLLGGQSYSGVSGDKTEASEGSWDYWVIKTDGAGNPHWQNTFGGSGTDDLYAVVQTSDGGYLLGGSSNSDISGDKTEDSEGSDDYWVLKLLPDVCNECEVPSALDATNITMNSAKLNWNEVAGIQGYKVRYKISDSPEWTYIQSINNDKTLTGLTPGTKYKWEVKTICSTEPFVSSDWSEKQTFTTAPLKSGDVTDETFLDVYPNPFSSSTTISFSLERDSKVKIELFDVAGKKLQTLLYEALVAGNHEVNLNRDQLNAGIYFIRLLINDEEMMRKVVVQ